MKVSITIPSLSDMRLNQYQKFLKTTKDSEDVDFIHRQLVGIFCNLSDNIVSKMTQKSFESVVADLSATLSQKEEQPLKRVIKHNGQEYGFIPDLDNITVGEQADISSFIADWQKMDKALGVLYRPITLKRKEGYLIEDYKGDGISLDVPLDVALGAYFFFVNLAKDLLSCTPNYIINQVKQDKRSMSLVENGVGITAFTESLKETFSTLSVLLK